VRCGLESPLFGFASRLFFGCASGLCFCCEACLLLCVAAGLFFGFGLGSSFGFEACLLLCFAAGSFFGFAPGLLLGLSSRPLLCLAAGLLFRFAPGLLFGLSPGSRFRFAAGLFFGFAPGFLFGLSPGSRFRFASGSLLRLAASLLFHFAAGLCFRFAPGFLLGLSSRPLLCFAAGLLFRFAAGLFLRYARRLILCFAAGLLLGGVRGSGLRFLRVDRVALGKRLPLFRQAHLGRCVVPPPSEHRRMVRRISAKCEDPSVIPIEERFPRPSVMGVLNITPDSFSDGGVHLDPDAASDAARLMIEEGAALVDVGGESTRPGSAGVPAGEELRRVVPVLDRLGGELPLSIDTSKAAVAREALERGAILVNDVTALRGDPELASVVADAGAYLCLMHMQREPRTMQQEPRYGDVAAEVAVFLEERLAFAVAQGIPEERICLDPGIGFGKTVTHNLELVRRLDVLLALGRPVLVGFSRKSSLRTLTGSDDLLGASVAAAVTAFERGATILRVHDVKPHVDALTVAAAVA
jgi:dihydropteroate synthase